MRCKSQFLRLAALGLAFASFGFASAQTEKPFIARAGFIFPVDKDVRDYLSKTGFTIGLGYKLKTKPLISLLSEPTIDLDYVRFDGNGNTVDSGNLFYVERVPIGKAGEVGGFYAGIGLGLSLTHIDVKTASSGIGQGSSGGGASNFRDHTWGIGGQLLAGYKFNEKIGVEAYYRMVPKVDGLRSDVIGIRVGYQF